MSKTPTAISLREVVGSEFCVASSDGDEVYNKILSAFHGNHSVVLSFKGVTALTSAFLNSAIGRLYGQFDEKTIRAMLRVAEIAPEDKALLRRVTETAKVYFKHPELFSAAGDETVDSSDEP